MSADALIEVVWRARSFPLAPVAAAARGRAARRLARRLLGGADEVLRQLDGVCGPELLIVTGPGEILPWVEGVTYLGRDERAPSVLWPTTFEPSAPLALVKRALTARFTNQAPFALLLDPPSIASLKEARPVARESLTHWLEGGG